MSLSFNYLYKKTGPVHIVSWADGTAAEIAAMLDAHDKGRINIYEFWSIGDERTVQLNAIAANPNGVFTKAMAAQSVVYVLMNEGYENQQGIHYVVGQKDLLSQSCGMNATNTNEGSWGLSLLRTDLNNSYYNSIADSDFKALFKDFTVTTIETYNGTTLQKVTDKFALFAEKEVFGSTTYSNTTEAAELSQIEYYKTAANRTKSGGSATNTHWRLRSPVNSANTQFCGVGTNASIKMGGSNSLGIAPFGCI